MNTQNISVSNSDLIENLKSMVKNERELLTEILRHLREVEVRQLFLERGYSSMFAYCTEALTYSEAEAHVRIQAMRLMSSVPMVERKIASGELIERFPEQSQSRPEVERPVSGGMTRLEFVISEDCLEKLKRLKNHMAHSNFEGRMDVLFEQLIDLALKKYEKHSRESLRARQVSALRRSDAQTRPNPVAPPNSSAQPNPIPQIRSRYISAQVRRQAWLKAAGQCQYFDPGSNRRCSCRYGLEVDHIHDFASGGSHALENLRLLCGAHNRWRSVFSRQA